MENNTITLEDKLTKIKEWLGTGAINIFGLPMSGKDTQGIKLAEAIDGKFISSGMIIRAMETATKQDYTGNGNLIPTNVFYEWVLPYLERHDLYNYPLVLSSVGRWTGEEDQVMSVASGAGHEVKAVIVLNLSEADVEQRFTAAKSLNDRGSRTDDKDLATFKNRIKEFQEKTVPVLQHYKTLGLLVEVDGNGTRERVFDNLIDALYKKAISA